jgi:hypothetical protein
MAYREPPPEEPAPPSRSTGARPRPPLSKGNYWAGYTLAIVGPVLLGAAFFVEALSADDADARRTLLRMAGVLYVWGVGATLGLRLWARRAGVEWNKSNAQAVRLIGEGRPDEAAVILDGVLRRSRLFPVAYSLYLWNRAVADTRRGRFSDARALCTSVLAARWFERRLFRHYVPAVKISLGLVEALAGDLDAAERWRREAHALLTSESSNAALPLDVLVATRRGQLDEAEALLRARWTAAEASLPARDMKLLRVLRAFIASRRTAVDRSEVDQWLAGARPVPKGMFDYVGTAWPEFAAFARAEL